MKVNNVINALDEKFPNPKCELLYNNDYELVLSTMLSAQTTDKRVNEVMSKVYEKYDTLEKLNNLTLKEIEDSIKSLGFYKHKSKFFKSITNELIKYDKVPNNRELLESISGLGRKSANVILSVLYNEPYIAVDTHVSRISKRFGISSNTDDVRAIEDKLYKYFKNSDYKKVGQQLVLYGRYVCTSKSPKCHECKLYSECKSKDKIKEG